LTHPLFVSSLTKLNEESRGQNKFLIKFVASLTKNYIINTFFPGRIDETELEVVMIRDGYTEPNTPYVIRANRTGVKTIVQDGATLYASEQIERTVSSWNTDFTIRGTYSRISASSLPSGTYYTMNSNDLGMGTGDGYVGAFRWYVTATDRESGTPHIQKIRIREFSAEDAINSTPAHPDEEGSMYDISGRKVSRPSKGIYIQNGKKIAVK